MFLLFATHLLVPADCLQSAESQSWAQIIGISGFVFSKTEEENATVFSGF